MLIIDAVLLKASKMQRIAVQLRARDATVGFAHFRPCMVEEDKPFHISLGSAQVELLRDAQSSAAGLGI